MDTSTGLNVWCDRFEEKLSEFFEIQNTIAIKVVGTIAPGFEQEELKEKVISCLNLEAYDCFLRAMADLHKWDRPANEEALSNLYRATDLDPKFAAAYGLAARAFVQRRACAWVIDRKSDIAEATRLARRAVELGFDDAMALCTAGFALAEVADQVLEGDAYVDRAIALSPTSPQRGSSVAGQRSLLGIRMPPSSALCMLCARARATPFFTQCRQR